MATDSQSVEEQSTQAVPRGQGGVTGNEESSRSDKESRLHEKTRLSINIGRERSAATRGASNIKNHKQNDVDLSRIGFIIHDLLVLWKAMWTDYHHVAPPPPPKVGRC